MKKILLLSLLLLTKALFAQVPANDECANATLLTASTTCSSVSGTIANATTSTTTPSCGGSKDVFYKFVANNTTAIVYVTGSSGLDVKVGAFSGCGTSYLSCADVTIEGGTETVSMSGLTIGNTYFIKVQDWTVNDATTYAFTICIVSTPATPANDVCANATLLTTSATCSPIAGTLKNATTSTTVPTCRTSYNSDVFYKFVANNTTASVSVGVTAAGIDPIVAAYSSCGGATVGCTDVGNDGEGETLNLTGLTIGATYFIQVSDYSSVIPTTFTFSICVVSTPAAPVNDVCANATLLTTSATCSPIAGTLKNATTSTTVPTCRTSYNSDVFYKFVANNTTASVTVGVTAAGMDPIVAVYASCGGASVACTDVGFDGAGETLNLTGLTVGATYFVQVSDYSDVLPTTFIFSICVVSTPALAPVNDECANATLLTPSTTCTPLTGTIANATTSTITPSCIGYYDVFYKFVANATTATVTAAGSSGLDLNVSAFATCGATNIGCVDANTTQGGTETLSLSSLIIGNTYYIKVANYTSTVSSTNTFTICVVSTPIVVPANDVCANATLLTTSATCSPIAGTLKNATTSTTVPTCRTSYNSDVFYKFVANNTTASVIVGVTAAGIDPIVAVYSACGGTSVGCADVGFDGAGETLNLTGLTVGATYFIQVSDYSDVLPTTFTFSICVVNTPINVTPPVNDACANAINLTPGTACTPTTGTLFNATNSTVTVCPGNYDVFYKFTATTTTATVKVTPSGTVDPIIGVLTSCTATTALACVDEGQIAGVAELATLTGLTVGTQYIIKVSGYSTVAPTAASTFTICVQNGITTATQSSTALSAISLYPNPTQNVLNIENISMDTKVELIDLTGKTIFVQDFSGDTQLDLSTYSAGVYILKLTSDGVSENRRVVFSK